VIAPTTKLCQLAIPRRPRGSGFGNSGGVARALGGDFVECRGHSRAGGFSGRRGQVAVPACGLQLGLQWVRTRLSARSAGGGRRADEGERQQTAAAVGQDATAGQHRSRPTVEAGSGAGIWVEHANILPLPHPLQAYRWWLARTTQDEELAVTQRTPSSSVGLPTPERVTELLADEFTRAGYEIDDVVVDVGTRPARIRVVADGDRPLDLDAVAELSRVASDLLDAIDTGQIPYVLEVSSPGVDRPLTAEKHFRRARGRKIELTLADGTTLTGRLGATSDGVAEVVVRAGSGLTVRRIPLTDIRNAVVQVEFSPPNAKELELVGGAGATHTEAGA
jgi:ribosome maturation factor RimP